MLANSRAPPPWRGELPLEPPAMPPTSSTAASTLCTAFGLSATPPTTRSGRAPYFSAEQIAPPPNTPAMLVQPTESAQHGPVEDTGQVRQCESNRNNQKSQATQATQVNQPEQTGSIGPIGPIGSTIDQFSQTGKTELVRNQVDQGGQGDQNGQNGQGDQIKQGNQASPANQSNQNHQLDPTMQTKSQLQPVNPFPTTLLPSNICNLVPMSLPLATPTTLPIFSPGYLGFPPPFLDLAQLALMLKISELRLSIGVGLNPEDSRRAKENETMEIANFLAIQQQHQQQQQQAFHQMQQDPQNQQQLPQEQQQPPPLPPAPLSPRQLNLQAQSIPLPVQPLRSPDASPSPPVQPLQSTAQPLPPPVQPLQSPLQPAAQSLPPPVQPLQSSTQSLPPPIQPLQSPAQLSQSSIQPPTYPPQRVQTAVQSPQVPFPQFQLPFQHQMPPQPLQLISPMQLAQLQLPLLQSPLQQQNLQSPFQQNQVQPIQITRQATQQRSNGAPNVLNNVPLSVQQAVSSSTRSSPKRKSPLPATSEAGSTSPGSPSSPRNPSTSIRSKSSAPKISPTQETSRRSAPQAARGSSVKKPDDKPSFCAVVEAQMFRASDPNVIDPTSGNILVREMFPFAKAYMPHPPTTAKDAVNPFANLKANTSVAKSLGSQSTINYTPRRPYRRRKQTVSTCTREISQCHCPNCCEEETRINNCIRARLRHQQASTHGDGMPEIVGIPLNEFLRTNTPPPNTVFSTSSSNNAKRGKQRSRDIFLDSTPSCSMSPIRQCGRPKKTTKSRVDAGKRPLGRPLKAKSVTAEKFQPTPGEPQAS